MTENRRREEEERKRKRKREREKENKKRGRRGWWGEADVGDGDERRAGLAKVVGKRKRKKHGATGAPGEGGRVTTRAETFLPKVQGADRKGMEKGSEGDVASCRAEDQKREMKQRGENENETRSNGRKSKRAAPAR